MESTCHVWPCPRKREDAADSVGLRTSLTHPQTDHRVARHATGRTAHACQHHESVLLACGTRTRATVTCEPPNRLSTDSRQFADAVPCAWAHPVALLPRATCLARCDHTRMLCHSVRISSVPSLTSAKVVSHAIVESCHVSQLLDLIHRLLDERQRVEQLLALLLIGVGGQSALDAGLLGDVGHQSLELPNHVLDA